MNKNSKLVSLQIPEKFIPILNKYVMLKNKKDDFVFPELKNANSNDLKDVFTIIKTANKRLDRSLAKSHLKPKSIKNLLRILLDITLDILQVTVFQHKCYKNYIAIHLSLRLCSINLNFISKETDKALGRIVDF